MEQWHKPQIRILYVAGTRGGNPAYLQNEAGHGTQTGTLHNGGTSTFMFVESAMNYMAHFTATTVSTLTGMGTGAGS